VDGLRTIGADVSKISGVGRIDHLKPAADLAGTYGSAGSASLKNDKGVVIEFRAKGKGVSLDLDLSGVHITMVPE